MRSACYCTPVLTAVDDSSRGLVETAARGYHQTMTRAWLILVGHAMAPARARFVEPDLASVLRPTKKTAGASLSEKRPRLPAQEGRAGYVSSR
jgi:hypothetical protein